MTSRLGLRNRARISYAEHDQVNPYLANNNPNNMMHGGYMPGVHNPGMQNFYGSLVVVFWVVC